jgi:hypothetical protein
MPNRQFYALGGAYKRIAALETALSGGGLTVRGQIQANTTYNVGDIVTLRGKRVLIKTQVTSNSSTTNPFISGSTYSSLSPENVISAVDFGWVADASQATAAANTAAMKNALAYCNTLGGGVVEIPSGFAYVNKDGSNAWAIDIPSFVTLRGQGMNPSRIQLADNQNCTVIKMHTSTGSGNSNAFFAGVENITIDGNKANNASGGHGLDMTTNPQFTTQTGDPFFDTHHLIRNVRIQNAKQNGVNIFGRSAIVLHGVYSHHNDGHGFAGSFDTHMSDCEAEGNGLSGFLRVSQMSNCKSFLNGLVDASQGHGFWTQSGGGTMVGCQAQNNYGHGLLIDNCKGVNVRGFGADTNNAGNQGCTAVALINAAANCVIDVTSSQTSQAGAGVLGYQQDWLQLDSGCTGNEIVATHYAGGGNSVNTPGVKSGSVLTGNSVKVNGVSLTATLASDTDVLIGTPTDGQVLTYDGASGKWKNLPGGSTAFFGGIFGTGVDGAATLDGTATVGWASKAGSVYTLTRDAHVTALTINSGSTLITNGYKIYCQGTVTNAGTISNDGNAGQANGTAGASAGSNSGTLLPGIGGGAGNTGAGTAGSVGGGSYAVVGTGNGGAGGLGSSGAGGGSTFSASTGVPGAPIRSAQNAVTSFVPTTLTGGLKAFSGGPSGGGGGGDGTNKGGGGGGGGGAIVILTHGMNNSGAISAIGGNGGSPSTGNAGGGGGGGGGVVAIYTLSAWTNTGTTNVAGGTGGTAVGTGANGSNGTVGNVFNFLVV